MKQTILRTYFSLNLGTPLPPPPPPKKKLFASRKAPKNDEKCYLLHFKSFFRFQDIEIFASTFFLSCRKNGLIRNL